MENVKSDQSSLHEHSVDIDQYRFMAEGNMFFILLYVQKSDTIPRHHS